MAFDESDILATHVNSYRNNAIDVDRLVEESNHRLDLIDHVERLEYDNSLVIQKFLFKVFFSNENVFKKSKRIILLETRCWESV